MHDNFWNICQTDSLLHAEYSDEDKTKEDWIEANLDDENYLALCETELKYEETESAIERVISIK